MTTTFFYDADGQRVMTSRPGGVVVYTPFPDYEREVAVGGAVTERTTYAIAGQMVAVRSAGTLFISRLRDPSCARSISLNFAVLWP